MKPQAPCLYCTERKPLCHGSCKRYADFKTADNKWTEMVRKSKKERYDVEGFFIDGYAITKKKLENYRLVCR